MGPHRESSFSHYLELFYTDADKAAPRARRTLDDMSDADRALAAEVAAAAGRLPDIEREVLNQIFNRGLSHTAAGRVVGPGPEMGGYWFHSAVRRLKWIVRIGRIDTEGMRGTLSRWMTAKQIEAVVIYFEFGHQCDVAGRLGITQAAVSSRLKYARRRLLQIRRSPFAEGCRSELWEYAEILRGMMATHTPLKPEYKKARRGGTVDN